MEIKYMTEQEKLALNPGYLSKNFVLLDTEGKEYLKNLSQQLLFIQYPLVLPSPMQKGIQAGTKRGVRGMSGGELNQIFRKSKGVLR
jgi:hypothetical protein